ncbi:MAG: radical SAM protein [Acidobacteriota bacterium]
MDVLLAHAYSLAEDAAEQRIMRPHPPLGLLYLSSHLKRCGASVGVFDGTFRTTSDFEAVLRRHRPPVVGLSVNLMTKRRALAWITLARAAGAKVVVGGPDPAPYAAEYLSAGADVVVVGEGERTIEALLTALAGSDAEALERIEGLVFARPDGAIARTAPRALIADLDAQPWPDREAIDLPAYLRAWRTRHGAGVASLITARGCPYTCTWCSRSVFGVSHRRRSVTGVADEVEYLVERYRPDRLWYADDVFAIHRTWTLAYADELARRRLRLPFECITRAERIDDSVADALVSLGCSRVWIGSESGSQRLLDAMERRVRVDQIHDATVRLRRRGIEVGLFVMLGFDGERFDDLRATVRHLKRTSPDEFLTTVAYPIKGTPYHARVADRLRAPAPWNARTDRDLVVTGRPGRRYYDFARRWMTGEVARHRHWQAGRLGAALRAASSAVVGRVGMALTSHWVQR